MRDYKILFTGTAGAGKTTAISAISDQVAVSTDVANSDASLGKATTTVAMDFGSIALDNGDQVRLFGTPGQQRFDFMWSILANNALGIVILIDNSRPAPLEDLAVYLDGFEKALLQSPCVVGVGRLEQHPHPDLDAFSAFMASRGLVTPIVAVDVRRRDDVMLLIDLLLTQIEAAPGNGA